MGEPQTFVIEADLLGVFEELLDFNLPNVDTWLLIEQVNLSLILGHAKACLCSTLHFLFLFRGLTVFIL